MKDVGEASLWGRGGAVTARCTGTQSHQIGFRDRVRV